MLKELQIAATEYTPEVKLNAESGELLISGRSMPEDIGGFFDPIASWIKEYATIAQDKTVLTIYFEYYNSSTARKVTELIFELEQLLQNGKEVKVIWHYKAGDLIMKENGEEIGSVVEIPFELVED